MEYKTRETDGSPVQCGGHLIGYIDVTYARLVKEFGHPNSDGDGYKTDAEWNMRFSDGTIATIYNWKDGKNYLGRNGMKVENITDWHVGGEDSKALSYVKEVLGLMSSQVRRM